MMAVTKTSKAEFGSEKISATRAGSGTSVLNDINNHSRAIPAKPEKNDAPGFVNTTNPITKADKAADHQGNTL